MPDYKQNIAVNSSSYASLSRQWQPNDQVKIVFRYRFHMKPMPDDESVVAFFYGPMLLACQSRSGFILKSDKKDILRNITVDNRSERTFKLTDNGKVYQLRPLFDIDKESFGVYAPLRDY